VEDGFSGGVMGADISTIRWERGWFCCDIRIRIIRHDEVTYQIIVFSWKNDDKGYEKGE
jgi:hypothetical protein